MSDLTKFEQMLHLYPISCDRNGDWSRNAPWKVDGGFFVACYSRTASDGKYQTAQVRVRRDLFLHKFAEVDIAGSLRFADEIDRRPARYNRPLSKEALRHATRRGYRR